MLGFAWAVTTIMAWFAILFTGRYPRTLCEFGLGVLRWTTRVQAYLLLLVDEYRRSRSIERRCAEAPTA